MEHRISQLACAGGRWRLIAGLFLAGLLLAACSRQENQLARPDESSPVSQADRQSVSFQSSDGQELSGVYYPPAKGPAPLIILMHWAPGDQSDWEAAACWLQNRGSCEEVLNPKAVSWLDPAWFPSLPHDRSYAVFTFTFRGCEGGCQKSDRPGWLLDAQAAVLAGREMPGVDAQRIVTVGASIGSDGAADGCIWLNQQFPGSCLGAFSISPGGYLTIPYADAVRSLGEMQPAAPAWCLYSTNDQESAKACQAASGEHYRAVSYQGSLHGMQLLAPNVQPAPLQLLLDFLNLVLAQ